MGELWMPVVGFEATHEVSNLGRVRTLPKTFYGGSIRKDGSRSAMRVKIKVLKSWLSSSGYPMCSLSIGDGKCVFRLIHRLVAEAHISPAPSPTHQVNHIDGDKMNPCAENLEWVTPSENSHHAYGTGLRRKLTGARINTTKLDEVKVREIRALAAEGVSQRKIAARYGMTSGPIHAIIHRRTWKDVA